MFLTINESRQLRSTFTAATEAVEIVRDRALTVINHPYTRLTGKAVFHALALVAAAAFFSGVLARRGFDAFMQWQETFVESCLTPAVEPATESTVLLLPPARDRRHNTTDPITNSVIIISDPTPAPVKRRGRPKGSKNRTRKAS